METTSCSLLNSLGFPSAIIRSTINKYYYETPVRHNHFYPFPSFSFSFPKNYNFPENVCMLIVSLLSVRPSVMTIKTHLRNSLFFLKLMAFLKLALDCANWTAPIYSDLIRKSADDEERMVILFFNQIGWPTSVPTSEKKVFLKNVLREKKNALDEFLVSKDAPLRPGVEHFVDNAYNEGIPVIVLTAYS